MGLIWNNLKNKPYAFTTLGPTVLWLVCKVIAYKLCPFDPVLYILPSNPRNSHFVRTPAWQHRILTELLLSNIYQPEENRTNLILYSQDWVRVIHVPDKCYILSLNYMIFFWEFSGKQYSSIFNFQESGIKIICISVEEERVALHIIDEIVIGLFYILCILISKFPFTGIKCSSYWFQRGNI